MLAAVAAVAALIMLPAYIIVLSGLEASVPWLLFGVALLVLGCVAAPYRWRQTRRSVRRMRTE